jgi:hypothetical protein
MTEALVQGGVLLSENHGEEIPGETTRLLARGGLQLAGYLQGCRQPGTYC